MKETIRIDSSNYYNSNHAQVKCDSSATVEKQCYMKFTKGTVVPNIVPLNEVSLFGDDVTSFEETARVVQATVVCDQPPAPKRSRVDLRSSTSERKIAATPSRPIAFLLSLEG